jgi:hypothetical protein
MRMAGNLRANAHVARADSQWRYVMALEDFAEPETAVAVGATAAIFSPRVREFLHRGAVYGVAGVLVAGDAVTSFARGVRRGLTAQSTTPELPASGHSDSGEQRGPATAPGTAG